MQALPESWTKRGQETLKSQANARRIESMARAYDGRLRVRFSSADGYYYLSRKALAPHEREEAAILDEGPGMFRDAALHGDLVVAYPIAVGLMENFDVASRTVMKHLQTYDMKAMAATREGRIAEGEKVLDEDQAAADARKASRRDDTRAWARQYYRDKIQAKAFFDLRALGAKKPAGPTGGL